MQRVFAFVGPQESRRNGGKRKAPRTMVSAFAVNSKFADFDCDFQLPDQNVETVTIQLTPRSGNLEKIGGKARVNQFVKISGAPRHALTIVGAACSLSHNSLCRCHPGSKAIG